MKIIVADDSKMGRKMIIKVLGDVLENTEFEILEAEDGQQCVDLYKEHRPQLVFLDLTMPTLDGFHALDEIKVIDKNATVVVISADIQKGSMERVKQSGAFDFVKKPIDTTKMRWIIEKLQRS